MSTIEELERENEILRAKVCMLSTASDLYWSQTQNVGWTKAGHSEPTQSFHTALSKDNIEYINKALQNVDFEAEHYWDEYRKKVIQECLDTLNDNEGYHTNINNAFGESWDQGFRCAMRALGSMIGLKEDSSGRDPQ